MDKNICAVSHRNGQMVINALDGRFLEKSWIEGGRNPEYLAKFLKIYPAGHYLSWVKDELSGWWAGGDFDSLKLLSLHKGERKFDTGLRQALIDFEIYRAVTELIHQGHTLTPNRKEDGIFYTLQEQECNWKKLLVRKQPRGQVISESQIRDRYYRFLNHQTVSFIDDLKTLICGPTRMDFCGSSAMVIFRWAPARGFTRLSSEQ